MEGPLTRKDTREHRKQKWTQIDRSRFGRTIHIWQSQIE